MRSPAVHRALDSEVAAARHRLGRTADVRVLDVGGGSGVWAVPLALGGCTVTVVDPSPNALATLGRRADEAGVGERVVGVQGDADALAGAVPAAGAELVLAHGVLEVVEDVPAAMAALAAAAAPHGAVSILAANRYAALLGRVLAGKLAEAHRLLDDPDGRLGADDPALRRFDADGLTALLHRAGLTVELLQGDGVLAELVPGGVLDAHPTAAEQLTELELAAAARAPLRDIAARLHLLARAPGGGHGTQR